MAIVFPAGVDTPLKKIRFCYRAMERCRMVYNIMRYWTVLGALTQDEYDNGIDGAAIGGQAGQRFVLPRAVKAVLTDPATPPITEQADLVRRIYMVRLRRYDGFISDRRDEFQAATAFDSVIDDDAN